MITSHCPSAIHQTKQTPLNANSPMSNPSFLVNCSGIKRGSEVRNYSFFGPLVLSGIHLNRVGLVYESHMLLTLFHFTSSSSSNRYRVVMTLNDPVSNSVSLTDLRYAFATFFLLFCPISFKGGQ
jgi:hypothetical protein